jgi:hypothetical protein
MKTIMILVVLLGSGLAFADAKGDKATALSRALKYAGVKPTTTKTVRTFKVSSAHCWSSRAGTDEELGDYRCTLDKREVKDAAAFLLQEAMDAAGAPSDDHMSQHTSDAIDVSCVIDPGKTGDDRASCSWKVKDIVQPVKIEKK